MKTAGVIAEYDPFHNGHKYHLEQTGKLTGADHIIAVISGNYTQRGTPAAFDKYTRAEMALRNGAQLVLELPLFYASGSAEYFAAGAAALLDKLGVVDFLCFGSECGEERDLMEIARILAEEPPPFADTLKEALRAGSSYPAARSLAYEACSKSAGSSSLSREILLQPNNILGIEYIRALLKRGSAIRPLTVKRKGAGYHDAGLLDDPEKINFAFSSASAVRSALAQGGKGLPLIRPFVPDSVYRLLSGLPPAAYPVTCSDFSRLLQYKLILEAEKGYEEYVDVSAYLSDRIGKRLNRFTDYEGFCSLLKTKETPGTRITRALLHILLDMKKVELQSYLLKDYILYARILGFRKDAKELLHAIRKNASVPLISKLADADRLLDETGRSMLQKEITASHIYGAVISGRTGLPFINEYQRQLVIL